MTVAVDAELLETFNRWCKDRGYIKEKLIPNMFRNIMNQPEDYQLRIYQGRPPRDKDQQFLEDVKAALQQLEVLPPDDSSATKAGKKPRERGG